MTIAELIHELKKIGNEGQNNFDLEIVLYNVETDTSYRIREILEPELNDNTITIVI